jgi:hypothetical protein
VSPTPDRCARCDRAECDVPAARANLDAFNAKRHAKIGHGAAIRRFNEATSACEARPAVDWHARYLSLAIATPAASEQVGGGAVGETVINEDPDGWWQERIERLPDGTVSVDRYIRQYEEGPPVGDWRADIDSDGWTLSPAAFDKAARLLGYVRAVRLLSPAPEREAEAVVCSRCQRGEPCPDAVAESVPCSVCGLRSCPRDAIVEHWNAGDSFPCGDEALRALFSACEGRPVAESVRRDVEAVAEALGEALACAVTSEGAAEIRNALAALSRLVAHLGTRDTGNGESR